MRGTLLDENRRLRREVEDLRLRLLRLTDVEGEMPRLGGRRALLHPARRAHPGRRRRLRRPCLLAAHAGALHRGRPRRGTTSRCSRPAAWSAGWSLVSGPLRQGAARSPTAPAAVGGMVLRTRRQGVVRGGGRRSGGLELDYVPLQADVRPGDRVVTAGIDGVYPRGIPIGTVVPVEQGGQLFHRIQLAPAVDFGALDQVYLLDYDAGARRRSRRAGAGGTSLSSSPPSSLTVLVHFVGMSLCPQFAPGDRRLPGAGGAPRPAGQLALGAVRRPARRPRSTTPSPAACSACSVSLIPSWATARPGWRSGWSSSGRPASWRW